MHAFRALGILLGVLGCVNGNKAHSSPFRPSIPVTAITALGPSPVSCSQRADGAALASSLLLMWSTTVSSGFSSSKHRRQASQPLGAF